MNYQRILENIGQQVQREFGKGKVADYIPSLARVPPNKFGITVARKLNLRVSFLVNGRSKSLE